MRHHVTPSLMSWCIILLLLLSSASARKPQTPCLRGTYTLNTAASDDIDKAIEATVKGMNIFAKPIARDRLRKTNIPPYQRIVISYTQAEVSITTDQRAPIRTPVKGTPVDWTREDGEKLKVSTIWENGKLKQTFKGKDGQRVNLCSISADEETLTMQVSVTSSKLPRPLTYTMVYKRII
jgi:hypothetical protein